MCKLRLVCWAFFVFMSQGIASAVAIEEAKYYVVLEEDDFEIRQYEPHVVAQTIVGGGFEEAGDKAFVRLFDYIAGNNESQQEVEMTIPVGQTSKGQEISMTTPVGQKQVQGEWAVSFMMPASFTLETLPKPKDESVTLRQVPKRFVASIQYSGFWSEEGYLNNKSKLEQWIIKKGFVVTGDPVWARYNPPLMPWFLRRNEILMPIAQPHLSLK